MKRLVPVTAALLVLTSLAASPVTGADAFFLPGDAFFHSVLTWQRLSALGDGAAFVLDYMLPPRRNPGFSQTYGIRTAIVSDPSGAVRKGMREIYKRVRQTYPRRLIEYADDDTRPVEENGVHIFIYNKDFTMQEHRLFMRYNENWFKEASNHQVDSHLGGTQRVPRNAAKLHRFVEDPYAIEWRDADLVGKLNVEPEKDSTRTRLDGATIQIIAIASEDLACLATTPYEKAQAIVYRLLPPADFTEWILNKKKWERLEDVANDARTESP